MCFLFLGTSENNLFLRIEKTFIYSYILRPNRQIGRFLNYSHDILRKGKLRFQVIGQHRN